MTSILASLGLEMMEMSLLESDLVTLLSLEGLEDSLGSSLGNKSGRLTYGIT